MFADKLTFREFLQSKYFPAVSFQTYLKDFIVDHYEVYVSNMGLVSDNKNDYEYYVGLSKINYGRAAGESVTLILNGEVISEYVGANTED